MIDVVEICEKVLVRLSTMDYETTCNNSEDRIIFPFKNQAKGVIDRISEQELRQLFIEEFKNNYGYLYYSIETPTVQKYNFKEISKENKDVIKQSALHDMCVFEKFGTRFKRILNIEFKYKIAEKSIEKDIFKLIHEEQNGAFIFLLKNTNIGTIASLCNKLSTSLDKHKKYWNGQESKVLHILILSLEVNKNRNGVPFLKHLQIVEQDLKTINNYKYEWI